MQSLAPPQPEHQPSYYDSPDYQKRRGRHRAQTFGERVLTLATLNGQHDLATTARTVMQREAAGDPTAERDASALYELMHQEPGSGTPTHVGGYQDLNMTHINRTPDPQPAAEQPRLDLPTGQFVKRD